MGVAWRHALRAVKIGLRLPADVVPSLVPRARQLVSSPVLAARATCIVAASTRFPPCRPRRPPGNPLEFGR